MGRTECPDLSGLRASLGWNGNFIESEMALFSECKQQCARKLLDNADIVRDAILQQLQAGQGMSKNRATTGRNP